MVQAASDLLPSNAAGVTGFHDFLEVGRHVGRELNHPAGQEAVMEVGKKPRGHQPAVPVASFGPRVREIDVKRGDSLGRDTASQNQSSVSLEQRHIGETAVSDASPPATKISVGAIEAEYVKVGTLFSSGNRKPSLPAPDLYLQWP